MRGALWILLVGGLVGVLAAGLSERRDAAGGAQPEPGSFDLQGALEQLRGAPPALASLHAESGRLLDGGERAFDERLRRLRGRPAVINKWASWCEACRSEFPIFQAVATERGCDVAFLGVNSADSSGPAGRFLSDFPLPYPSYADPDEDIARAVMVPKNFPATVFVDRSGRTTIKYGRYLTAEDLESDIDRYAGRDEQMEQACGRSSS